VLGGAVEAAHRLGRGGGRGFRERRRLAAREVVRFGELGARLVGSGGGREDDRARGRLGLAPQHLGLLREPAHCAFGVVVERRSLGLDRLRGFGEARRQRRGRGVEGTHAGVDAVAQVLHRGEAEVRRRGEPVGQSAERLAGGAGARGGLVGDDAELVALAARHRAGGVGALAEAVHRQCEGLRLARGALGDLAHRLGDDGGVGGGALARLADGLAQLLCAGTGALQRLGVGHERLRELLGPRAGDGGGAVERRDLLAEHFARLLALLRQDAADSAQRVGGLVELLCGADAALEYRRYRCAELLGAVAQRFDRLARPRCGGLGRGDDRARMLRKRRTDGLRRGAAAVGGADQLAHLLGDRITRDLRARGGLVAQRVELLDLRAQVAGDAAALVRRALRGLRQQLGLGAHLALDDLRLGRHQPGQPLERIGVAAQGTHELGRAHRRLLADGVELLGLRRDRLAAFLEALGSGVRRVAQDLRLLAQALRHALVARGIGRGLVDQPIELVAEQVDLAAQLPAALDEGDDQPEEGERCGDAREPRADLVRQQLADAVPAVLRVDVDRDDEEPDRARDSRRDREWGDPGARAVGGDGRRFRGRASGERRELSNVGRLVGHDRPLRPRLRGHHSPQRHRDTERNSLSGAGSRRAGGVGRSPKMDSRGTANAPSSLSLGVSWRLGGFRFPLCVSVPLWLIHHAALRRRRISPRISAAACGMLVPGP
jgi:hypothetical protein